MGNRSGAATAQRASNRRPQVTCRALKDWPGPYVPDCTQCGPVWSLYCYHLPPDPAGYGLVSMVKAASPIVTFLRASMGGAVRNFLSALTLLLLSSWALAATKEMQGANAPVETVDTIWVVVFVVIFIGSIVGFFVYLYWSDRKQKPDQ